MRVRKQDPSKNYNWTGINVNDKAAKIASKLSNLGYNVNIELVSVEPLISGAQPPGNSVPTTETDKTKTTGTQDEDVESTLSDSASAVIITILVLVGVIFLMAVAGCYMGWRSGFGRSQRDEREQAPLQPMYGPLQQHEMAQPPGTPNSAGARQSARWRYGGRFAV